MSSTKKMKPTDYGPMIAARVPAPVKDKFDWLAEATGRRKQHLLTEAIDVLYERYGPDSTTRKKGPTD